MQYRDLRILMIDLVFPIILIVAGLALSKIQVISTGVPRVMSPSLFPQPSPYSFNSNGSYSGSSEGFFNTYMGNNSAWK